MNEKKFDISDGVNPEDMMDALNYLASNSQLRNDAEAVEVCTNYGDELRKLANKYHEEHHITTLAIWTNPDLLDHAFIGGAAIVHEGSQKQMLMVLYQLMKVCFDKLVEKTNRKFTAMLFNQMMESLENGNDYPRLGQDDELDELRNILKDILDRMHNHSNDDDEDEDD